MNRILRLLIIVIVIIIFTAGGVWFGISYQTQKDNSQIKELPAPNPVLKKLSSKLVSSINSYGKVSKIEGINITLTSGEESLTIQVKENVSIFTYIQTLPLKKGDIPNMVQQKLNLKDIKNGDSLDVSLKLLPNGQLDAQSIYVLPPLSQDIKK